MTIPLIVLAVCAALVGLVFGPDRAGSSTTSSDTPGFEPTRRTHEHALRLGDRRSSGRWSGWPASA